MLAACFVLNMFGRGLGDTYAVFLLPLEREFGWTRSQVTGVYSLYLLVNGLTAPLVGMLFDRLGARWVYGAGTLCLGAAFFLAGGLVSLWQYYLLVGALVGLGVSLNGMVPGSALLARWYRARLSTAIGIAFSAVGVGVIVFVPLAQFLVTYYDWRLAYRLMGGLLLLLAPIVILVVPWGRFMAGDPELRGEARLKAQGEGWTPRAALRTPCVLGTGHGVLLHGDRDVRGGGAAGRLLHRRRVLAADRRHGLRCARHDVRRQHHAERDSFGPLRLPADRDRELHRHRQRHGDPAADSRLSLGGPAGVVRRACSACAWACAGRSCPRCARSISPARTSPPSTAASTR